MDIKDRERRRLSQVTSSEGEKIAKDRKTRSDKGMLKRTERDDWALDWVGEQMVVRLDHLQRVLGRYAQRATQAQGILALSSTKDVVHRWKAMGLAEYDTLYHKKPAFVWLTAKGQRQVELPYKATFNPVSSRVRHYFYVNEIRIQLEAQFGDTIRWISERRLVHLSESVSVLLDGKTISHYPDAVVEKDELDDHGSWVSINAIEAELSTKSKVRTTQILTALADKYKDGVFYYVLPETKVSVINRIDTLSDTITPTYTVRDLQKTF